MRLYPRIRDQISNLGSAVKKNPGVTGFNFPLLSQVRSKATSKLQFMP